MPRTSRVQPSSKPGRQGFTRQDFTRQGFTLIETVVALALCALVAGVTAASLHAALGAERRAVKLREARRAGTFLHLALRSPGQQEALLEPLRVGWTLSAITETTGSGTNRTTWTRWTVQRMEDPSQQEVVYARE